MTIRELERGTIPCARRQATALVLALAAACAPGDEPAREAADVASDSVTVADSAESAETRTPLRGVVFAYESHGEPLLVQPVVVIGEDGALADAPDDTTSADGRAFVDRYFAAGERYGAYRGGNPRGSIQIDSVNRSGCSGLSAFGSWTGEGDLSEAMSGLLLTELSGGGFVSDAPRDDEVANACAAAVALLREAGEPPERLAKPLWHPSYGVPGRDGYRAVVVAGHFPTDPSEDAVPPSVLAVVESVASAPRVRFSVVATTDAGGPQSRLIDVLDVDGDGALELLVQNVSRYSWNYTIHRRQGGAWSTLFDGAARGC